ncbi:hypothetical protein CHS0354_023350, partial [Potamilus streckersoni]
MRIADGRAPIKTSARTNIAQTVIYLTRFQCNSFPIQSSSSRSRTIFDCHMPREKVSHCVHAVTLLQDPYHKHR